LFGRLSVASNGQPISAVQGRKCRDLLGYLLLRHNIPHSREHLAALFWGDRDARSARRCFNTAIWRLQAAFADEPSARRWLRIDAQTVSCCPDEAVFVDTIDFARRCTLADGWSMGDVDRPAAIRREAVSLYRGDLLADCYEDWCLADRERLQRLYVRALRRLVQYHRQRYEFEIAIDDARRILACDPLCEEIHRELIRLYLDCEQPDAALRQYHACADGLKRELGIAPMPDTSLLLQRAVHARRRNELRAGTTATVTVPAEKMQEASLDPTGLQRTDAELMLQLCDQLRAIATTLESVAVTLGAPQCEAAGSARVPPFAHEQRQVLAQAATCLQPVAALMKQAVSVGDAHVYSARASPLPVQ
jgi:DNA-binding SARP family transcriptional activator